jgi:hypothetical protein
MKEIDERIETERQRRLTMLQLETPSSRFSSIMNALNAQMYKKVSLEIFEERKAICMQCPHRRDDACGICGCKVIHTRMFIKNLAQVDEQLPRWGCKHPERSSGKGWLR